MDTKEYLSYRNFLTHLNKNEKDAVYAILGYCVENKKPHPLLLKEWDDKLLLENGAYTLWLVYSNFSNEQKNILLRLAKRMIENEVISCWEKTLKGNAEDHWLMVQKENN